MNPTPPIHARQLSYHRQLRETLTDYAAASYRALLTFGLPVLQTKQEDHPDPPALATNGYLPSAVTILHFSSGKHR
jgi:hypothetical protein